MNVAELYLAKLNQEMFIELHIVNGNVDQVFIREDLEKAKENCINFWQNPENRFDEDVDNTQIWDCNNELIWSYSDHYWQNRDETEVMTPVPSGRISMLDGFNTGVLASELYSSVHRELSEFDILERLLDEDDRIPDVDLDLERGAMRPEYLSHIPMAARNSLDRLWDTFTAPLSPTPRDPSVEESD